jgi:hydroxymethylbilane synthase
MKKKILIATRKSSLALWQANYVKARLLEAFPDLQIDLLAMLTTADKMSEIPLNKLGGKGLFVKELEKALLEHKADLAVHSVKDMPFELPAGLVLTATMKREDPRDVLVSTYDSLAAMPAGATVGTSSLRRRAQVLAIRPDLTVKPLRGNVETRLAKLDAGEFEGIILAAAGLKRLNLIDRIKYYFPVDEIIPAVGQGALGIECREEDDELKEMLNFLNDKNTHYCIKAERSFNAKLGGSCQFPIAGHAILQNEGLTLTGVVGDLNGTQLLKTQSSSDYLKAEEIGLEAAENLLAQGAEEILQQALIESRLNDTNE